MRKLIVLMGLVLVVASCQENPSFSELEDATLANRMTEEEEAAFLLSSSKFEPAYRKAVDRLNETRTQLTKGVEVERLKSADGMLVIQSAEEFRPIYDQVVKADTVWKNQYEAEIDALVKLVKADDKLAAGFEEEDEISWAIEDLLEADRVGYEDVMQNVSDRMPISTLWGQVKRDSDEWLASQEGVETPNWEQYPEEKYGIEPYSQLFVNNALTVNIQDTVREVEAIVSVGKGDEQLEGRVLGANGCRTFRMRRAFGDNGTQNGATRLRVRCYVNNFWIWKSYGVSCKGWIRRRGRWKARRYEKVLTQGGTIISHTASLQDPCDPVFAITVGWTKVRRHRSFSINRTLWGPDVYLGVCRQGFAGVVSGRGVAVGVVMD